MKIRPEQAAIIIVLNEQVKAVTAKRDLALEVALAGLIDGEVVIKKIYEDGTVTVEEKK